MLRCCQATRLPLGCKTWLHTSPNPSVSVQSIASKSWQYLHKFKLDGKEVTRILRNSDQNSSIPTPALVYGTAGLIPFWASPVYMLSLGLNIPTLTYANLAYAATILSFLGGVRWGAAIAQMVPLNWSSLGVSVLPSIVAWFGLLLPLPCGTTLITLALIVSAYTDLALRNYPTWFRRLRVGLTLGAVLALCVTGLCSFFPNEEQKFGAKKTGDMEFKESVQIKEDITGNIQ